MGVSGCGKSTIGMRLAERLGAPFLDGDDFHPPENVRKMAAGFALDDTDREPWLARINAELSERAAQGESVVLACSALREAYRARLGEGLSGLRVVWLRGGQDLIAQRLAARSHRYMPASLLPSQFAALEPPSGAIDVDIAAPVEDCVNAALAALAP